MYKIFISLLLTVQLHAVCNTTTFLGVDIISKACYSCMLPLRISGVTVMSGPLPDAGGSVGSPICMCPMPYPPYIRYGIPVSFFEPSRLIEVVKDAGCHPLFGFEMDLGYGSDARVGNNINPTSTFFQAHYYIFPLYALIEMFTDWVCVENAQMDMAYITEIDPLWNDDELSAIMSPEALLFGNPMSQMICIADSIASQIDSPLDPLFWCQGSWGSSYPLTGNIKNSGNLVEDSASVASNLIYKLHRQLILWASWGQLGLCGKYPAPIWRKSAYRLQIMSPMFHPLATGIGKSGLMWSQLKNPAFIGDNFGYLLFKKRECCAL
jgi:conjugal transfer pilus assembly protein TraU